MPNIIITPDDLAAIRKAMRSDTKKLHAATKVTGSQSAGRKFSGRAGFKRPRIAKLARRKIGPKKA